MLTAPPAQGATARAERKRIAQIIAASSHCEWFTDICIELKKRGHEVHAVIDSTPGDLAGRLASAGIRTTTIPMAVATRLDRLRLPFYLLTLPVSLLRLAWILRRERIDVAHSHVFVANVLARLACTLTGTKHVAGIAAPRPLEARLTRAVERWTHRLDARIVAGSIHAMELYRELGVDRERLACVYYGGRAERLDPDRHDGRAFRRELGIPDDTPLVGIVAHFYPAMRGPQAPPATRGVDLKGREHFLAAARIVSRRFPQARFVLVGSGSNARGEALRQELIESCRRDGFIDRVFFPGHRSDLADVLAAFDVAVQSSISEGLGGTIDALLMRRPLVVTSAGGMPESARHEETALVVPVADAAALAAAIERLLTNRDEAQRLARAGRALMIERFTLGRTMQDLEEIYAEL